MMGFLGGGSGEGQLGITTIGSLWIRVRIRYICKDPGWLMLGNRVFVSNFWGEGGMVWVRFLEREEI